MRLRAKIRKFVIKYFSEAVIFFLKRIPRKQCKISKDTILIIRFATLGETLLTFPMVRAIKQALSNSRIFVLTQNRPLWETNRDVDQIIDYSFMKLLKLFITKFRVFDIVVDTQPTNNISAIAAHTLGKTAIGFNTINRAPMFDYPIDFNDQQYEVRTFLDLLQPIGINFSCEELIAPIPFVTEKNISKFEPMFSEEKIKIGINLGASYGAPQRLWPVSNYGKLIQDLNAEFFCQFIFFGLEKEQQIFKELASYLETIDYVDLINRLSLHDLILAIKEMDIFISTDTGTMHLASSLKIPVFSFFGPNLPIRFSPRNIGSKHFYHQMACSPCINVHLPPKKKTINCKGECVKAITVDEVSAAIAAFINNSRIRYTKNTII